MLFDSHFHLTDPRLVERQGVIVGGFDADNICGGVEIGANFEELPAVFEFASKTPNVYCTAGVHPLYASDYIDNDFVNFVASHIGNKKFVAIGECGLDFHRPELAAAADMQKFVFIRHIEIANQYKMPLVVHSRDAAADTIQILTEHKDKLKHGVLIHCVSYSADTAKELLSKLDGVAVYFAFGGAITYKKNLDAMAETIRAIPADRILLETDAPYLSPETKRGSLNEPKFIVYTAARIAEILGLTAKETAELTASNAKRFYLL
jgi:TatD DNase family protein